MEEKRLGLPIVAKPGPLSVTLCLSNQPYVRLRSYHFSCLGMGGSSVTDHIGEPDVLDQPLGLEIRQGLCRIHHAGDFVVPPEKRKGSKGTEAFKTVSQHLNLLRTYNNLDTLVLWG